MFLIKSLEYIVFHTPNVKKMSNYYEQFLGMRKGEGSTEDDVFLKIENNRHSLIIRKSNVPQLGEIGFLVKGQSEWDEIVSRLISNEMLFEEIDSEDYDRTISFDDCDGHPIRLHLLQQETESTTTSARFGPILSRLHHVTYASPNPARIAEFYQDILGFKVSDMVEGGNFYWLRTDKEHHTVAVAANTQVGLDHFAFELPDWGSFKNWCDFLASQQVEIVWGPGRHGPGNNLFFFTLDPDGNRVEYSSELEKFQDQYMEYTPRVWKKDPKSVNLWGPGAPWKRELPLTSIK